MKFPQVIVGVRNQDQCLQIVDDLEGAGLECFKDFNFEYRKSNYWNNPEFTDWDCDRTAVFQFRNESLLTWFLTKYGQLHCKTI
jgi:hypothetical protein